MRALRTMAAVVLSSAWFFIAFANLLAFSAATPGDAAGLPWAVSALFIAVEMGLATALLAVSRTTVRMAALASAGWLVVLAVGAIVLEPSACRCAGVAVELEPGTAFAVIGVLFLLSAAAMPSRGDAPPRRRTLPADVIRRMLPPASALVLALLLTTAHTQPSSPSGTDEARAVDASLRPPAGLAASAPTSGRDDSATVPGAAGEAVPPAALRGVLVDAETGRPIEAGRVWVLSRPEATEVRSSEAAAVAATDAEGRFQLPLRPSAFGRGEGVAVAALAKGYASACVTGTATEPMVVRLSPGGQIDGVVLDEQDRPVPGARVEARGLCGDEVGDPESDRADRPPFRCSTPPDYGWETTQADGSFRVRGLAGGSTAYTVSFHSKTHSMDESTVRHGGVVARVGQSVTLRALTIYAVRVLLVDEATDSRLRGSCVSFRSRRLGLVPTVDVTSRDWRDPEHRSDLLTDGVQTYRGVSKDGTLDPVSVVTSAVGYEQRVVELQPQPWPWPVQRLPLRRAAGADIREVPVEARFASGAGFTGPLSVRVTDPKANQDGYSVHMTFRDGASEVGLPIDAGRGPCLLIARGTGLAGEFWQHCGDTLVEDPARIQLLRFQVKGTILNVRVREANGAPLYGYGLNVQYPSGIAIVDTIRAERREPGYLGVDGAWRCWLPPGRTTLSVTKPGFSSVRRDVDAAEEGEVHLDIALNASSAR